MIKNFAGKSVGLRDDAAWELIRIMMADYPKDSDEGAHAYSL